MADTTYTFADRHDWYAAFADARTTYRRFKALARLPRRLSRGWLATVADAAALARDAGQNTVAARLDARVARADNPTDDGTAHDTYTCPRCGEAGPLDMFGVRRVTRTPPLDDNDRPVLRPGWTLDRVQSIDFDARKATVRITVRQSQCSSCRGKPARKSEKKTDEKGE